MTPRQLARLSKDLQEFSDYLAAGMGRRERKEAMRLYMQGLLLDGDRKSTEPMARRLAASPEDAGALRQRLQQCVSFSNWSEEEVYRRIATRATEEISYLSAFVIDDTGFPKKGVHTVGVARQYSGTLGRTDNCQVAASLHMAGRHTSVCIGMRLYLPKEWTEDQARCREAGIPANVVFQEKWRLALTMLRTAQPWGLAKLPVLADAGYGDVTEFRESITKLGLPYVVGVSGTQVVWLPNDAPIPITKPESKPGRPRKYTPASAKPLVIRELAPYLRYQKVEWRSGSYGKLASRFARLRVRIAHGHAKGRPPGEELWLVCEWPEGEPNPTKYYLSNLPESTPLKRLVDLAKTRWRIERDYQEMKEELGLDHFEGRTWAGFHHHAALCAASHAFLALQRALFPPE